MLEPPLALVLAVLALALAACRRPAPLLAMSGPRDFLSFELRDAAGAPLWRVEASEPQQLSLLVYGRVPRGFAQTEPADGRPPRPLVPGEEVTAVSVTRLRVFTHRARAEGPGTLEILGRGMALRAPPAESPAGPRAADP